MRTLRHSRSSARLATQAFELSIAAPQVIAYRLARLAFAGLSPSARDRREFARMGTEGAVDLMNSTFYPRGRGGKPVVLVEKEPEPKGDAHIAAFYESWNAMYLALLRANLSLALSPFQVWWSPARGRRTGLTILNHGLAPIRRRATANARRLRRTRIV